MKVTEYNCLESNKNKYNLKELSIPLPISDVDFRIKSINKVGYAIILAYKNARADMNRLDQVVGPLNWKREHSNANANCSVSVWCEDKKQWISKEDTGTESFAEKQKGLASDSFKRACFNWGIGRELYDYPRIQIKLNQDEFTVSNDKAYASWNLKLKDWVWGSEFDNEFNLTKLAAKDEKGTLRFKWNK